MISERTNGILLDAMVDKLGMKDTIEMYEYALLKIPEKKNKLQSYIVSENWLHAHQMAHKSLSSARLYGTEKLERLLRQVRLVGTPAIDAPVLAQELSDEFDYVSEQINQWLDLHKKT
jgi:hypothetical protein